MTPDHDPAREALVRLHKFATDELRNTGFLASNPPQSDAAWNIRNAISREMEALAAQDQKPVAYISQSGLDRLGAWFNDADSVGIVGEPRFARTIPLYLSPPPAAGWNDKLLSIISALDRASGDTDPSDIGADEECRDQYPVIWAMRQLCALRHNAPSDTGAGKAEPAIDVADFSPENICRALAVSESVPVWIRTLASSAKLPDHGGADAGVKVSRDVLLTLISVLDCALGDTDPSIDPDYTDDEVKRDYPVFWVCQQLAALSHQPAPVAANDADQISALAHRFWSVHPREIQDMGITREQFYQREMTALVENISDQRRRYQSVVLKPDQVDLLLSRAPVAANASAEARLREGPYNIKAIATVISLSYGEDPEADAELGRICTADNKPVKCWEVYEEQAKALFIWFNAVLDSLSTHPHASDCDKQGWLAKDVEAATKRIAEWKDETTKSEASSHEKRRLDASGELTSTGPETSISPVRMIAQRHVSTPDANHDVTAGETATPSDRTADVTVEELAAWLTNSGELILEPGWTPFARALLDAYGMWRR